MTIVDWFIERDGQEIDITCELVYYKACRGARDSLCGKRGAGPPLEPDEPAYFEFIRAIDENGKEIDLTDDEIERIIEKAWDTHE